MKKLEIILGLLSWIWIFSCTQKEANPVGSLYFDDEDLAHVQYQTLYAANSDTSFQVSTATGNSDFLYIGRMNDMQSSTLFIFDSIADTAEIDSAVLLLNVYRLVNQNTLPAVIDIHTMNTSWDDSMTDEDFDASMIGDRIGSITVSNDTIDSLFFRMDTDLVTSWMDTTSGTNYGLCLSTEDDAMLQCFSRDISSTTSSGPQLWIYFKDDSTRYPEIDEAGHDTFIATSDFTADPHLMVETGTAFRSYLEFDLSMFTENTIINQAVISLTADTLQTLPALDQSIGLMACYLDSAFDITSVECESANSGSGLFEDGMGSIDMTYVIQDMISERKNNLGFLIQGQYETSELSRMVFFSTEADSASQPRLEITYTLPPANSL